MRSQLEFLQNHSLTSVLQRELEALVLSGEFQPGERLNENSLAARFSVSRGPVREVCRALAEKGLLEHVPNRGVFMRRMDERQAAELYDVRAGLFAAANRVLALSATREQISTLEGLLERMEAAVATNSLDDYYPLNLEFHDSILRFAGNSRLHRAYAELIKELHLFRERALLQGGVNLGFMFMPIYRAWVVVASILACLLTWFVIEKTRLGALLRAGTENPKLVEAFGVNVPLMISLTFGFGVGLAGFAGVLAAPILQVSPLMGSNLIIVVFAVVVIGGMGSILGSIVTGLGLGVIEGFTKVFWPEASSTVVFIIMVIVLLTRPAGLFGKES